MGLPTDSVTIRPEEFKRLVRSRVPLPPKVVVSGSVELAFAESVFQDVDTLCVEGSLILNDCLRLTTLPRQLLVKRSFRMRHALKLEQGPRKLLVLGSMYVLNCPMLRSLAGLLNVGECLNITQCRRLRCLPAGAQVGNDIQIEDCPALESLGGLLETNGSLVVRRCGLREFSPRMVGGSLLLQELPFLERLSPHLCVGAKHKALSWRRQGPRYIFNGSFRNLYIHQCNLLKGLSEKLVVDGSVEIGSCRSMESLCDSMVALGDLTLKDNPSLDRIGRRVTVRGSCRIEDAPHLSELSHRLSVGGSVTTSQLPRLRSLGEDIRIGRGLDLSNLTQLSELPPSLSVHGDLILRGLRMLTRLPPQLVLDGLVEVSETGLTGVPGYEDKIMWQGIPVSATTAFHPEALTVEEITRTEDLAARETMLRRFTYERFITKAGPEVLDEDMDRGGERRLLRVTFPNTRLRNTRHFRSMNRWEPPDSAIVCLSVQCPSTGALYIMRVPPEMQTCGQAAAWIAGFDSPDEYRPEVET